MFMANRIIDDKNRTAGRTEFQLHISQFQSYFRSKKVLRDFSESRLRWYLENMVNDPIRAALIQEIIDDYAAGKVAIAWKAGEPVYVRMNKGT